ncbi:PEPxxWA-CTERM sorting domain-containing protein [Sphingomonas sp.]|uniref:PEPxxWA-CTERM sorting domain-containing protein n=1 Tax=Sphingomonas sp. TaxID=28214 RepID=UPI0025E50881|nr:PEPxxWA-CTERM sorting domain-containing protein [Sphingomonas sp.]
MFRRIILLSAVMIGLHATAATAQNLVVNGSFETNTLSPGNYRDMLVGSPDLPGWTIIGPAGTHISQVDQAYAGNPGYSFPAQDGKLWVDLAGYSDNAPDGVQQTVATTIGASYDFSFWLGNVTGGQYFGTQSLVNVLLNGSSFSCVNTVQTLTTTWQQCSRSFVATSALTTFSISNGDPSSDYSNAIDNVVLQLSARQPGGVPEPATWATIIMGFGVIGGALRRRQRDMPALA